MRNTSITNRSARLLLGVAALGGVAQSMPALADAPAMPPPAAPFSWTGVYIGASLGHTSGDSTGSAPAGSGDFGGSDTAVIHHNGTTYGGQIGYNYQIGHSVLVGLEASLDGTSQNAGNTYPFNYTGGEGYSGPLFGVTSVAVRNTFAADVSARLGVTVNHLLIFAKSGVAFSKYNYSGSIANVTGPQAGDLATVTYTGSQNRTGFLIGGGVEYAINNHWSIKAEYNHVRFATKVLTFTGSDSSTFILPIGETADTVKAGINYRF